MRKFFNIILFVILMMILLWVCYARFFQKEKMIQVLGYRFLVVLTGSMEPEIQRGSFIVIKNSPQYEIR